MNLTSDSRIDTIVKMVTPAGIVADIGCDHCLTLIRLIKSGVCRRGIGSDIKRGPLERARENVELYGLSDKIELRLGDGVSKIAENEADAIILSGMGGLLVNSILEDGLRVVKSAKELILQPQSHIDAVRRSLHNLGFMIIDEGMTLDRGKYYTVIKAAKGVQRFEHEREYVFGKALIEKKCPVLKRFLSEKSAKTQGIIATLKSRGSHNCALKIAELNEENLFVTEVLKCL